MHFLSIGGSATNCIRSCVDIDKQAKNEAIEIWKLVSYFINAIHRVSSAGCQCTFDRLCQMTSFLLEKKISSNTGTYIVLRTVLNKHRLVCYKCPVCLNLILTNGAGRYELMQIDCAHQPANLNPE